MRERQVARFAAEIRNGTFRLSSDAILLVKGRLANGQHRLAAVVEANKSAQFIVMRTNDEQLYKVIDSGASRTIADVLGRADYSVSVASSTRLICLYDLDLLFPSGTYKPILGGNSGRKPITRSIQVEYAQKHYPELAEQCALIHSLYLKTRICPISIAVSLLHIASRQYPKEAKQFIQNVFTGESADAAKDFRDRMIRQMGSRVRQRQEYVFALLIKCWRSFLKGTRPGSLKIAEGEEFPEI